MTDRIDSYRAFWPHYLRGHRKPVTRGLHYAGTGLAVGCVVLAAMSGNPLWLAAALPVGYGAAWLAHVVVERNRPGTFRHPLWSLIGDFHMAGLFLSGRLGRELDRHGLRRGPP